MQDVDVDPLNRATGLTAGDFAARHWAKAPLLRRAADLPGDGFTDLLSLAAVDELVSQRGLRTPFLRMAKEGDVLPARRFTAAAEPVPTSPTRPPTTRCSASSPTAPPSCCRDCTGCGRRWCASPRRCPSNSAIRCRSTHTSPRPEPRLRAPLRRARRVRVAVRRPQALDDPPARARGAVAHPALDDRKPEVAAAALGRPVIDTVLEPGDALYLPRGYLHAASALGEVSGHLTIGVHR